MNDVRLRSLRLDVQWRCLVLVCLDGAGYRFDEMLSRSGQGVSLNQPETQLFARLADLAA